MSKNIPIEHYKNRIERLLQLTEASKAGLWEMTPEGAVTFYNSGFYENFSVTIPDSSLQEWTQLIHPEDQERFDQNIMDQVSDNKDFFKSIYRVKNKAGAYVWIEAIGKQLYDDDQSYIGLVGSHTDVTDRIQQKSELENLAYFDNLTGLYNKTSLLKKLHQEIDQKHEGALLYINLKNFRDLNDMFGFYMGDQVLIAVANRLKRAIKPPHYLSRITGDEFVILLTGHHSEAILEKVAFDLIKLISEPIRYKQHQFVIKVSVGITTYPKNGMDASGLLQEGNLAMSYCRKNQGQDLSFYNDHIKMSLLHNLRIEHHLKEALSREELSIHYQPIVALQTGKIEKLEALARWENHELGIISPITFIPIAERNHLIIPIGQYVLRALCDFIKNHDLPQKVRLSINVSAVELLSPNFAKGFIDTIESYGLSPDRFDIEITESTALNEHFDQIKKVLTALISYGITISLDDFGAGYSNLDYLFNLPLHAIKFDRKIVMEAVGNHSAYTFLQAIINFALREGLDIVLEGIEDEDMIKALEEIGASHAQGYYYAKPVAGKEILDLLSS